MVLEVRVPEDPIPLRDQKLELTEFTLPSHRL